jgi:hypothetical protein
VVSSVSAIGVAGVVVEALESVFGREVVSGCGRGGEGRTTELSSCKSPNEADTRSGWLENKCARRPGSRSGCTAIKDSNKKSGWLSIKGGNGRGDEGVDLASGECESTVGFFLP